MPRLALVKRAKHCAAFALEETNCRALPLQLIDEKVGPPTLFAKLCCRRLKVRQGRGSLGEVALDFSHSHPDKRLNQSGCSTHGPSHRTFNECGLPRPIVDPAAAGLPLRINLPAGARAAA
jgi:hypothetical protein